MKNSLLYNLFLFFLGLIILLLLLEIAPGFGSWGEALVVASFFVSAFFAFDKWVMKEIDTISELKKGNIAYALALIAFALVLLASAILVG